MALILASAAACVWLTRGGTAAVAACPGGWSAPVEAGALGEGGPSIVQGAPQLVLAEGGAYAFGTVSPFRPGAVPPPAPTGLIAERIGGPGLGRPPGGAVYGDPAVAFDADGALQMLWAEPPDTSAGARRARRGRVFHAEYRDGRWSHATLVYQGTAVWWDPILNPDPVLDDAGRLHLAFSAVTTSAEPVILHLRREPEGWRATELREFPGADVVPSPGGGYPRLLTLPGGRLYLAFASGAAEATPGAARARDVNSVFFVRSQDGGATWGPPVLVSRSGADQATEPQLLAGRGDTLHLVWGKNLDGGVYPQAVWHARSGDGGATWTRVAELRPPEVPGAAQLLRNVRAVMGVDGTLHLAFAAHRPGRGPISETIFHARFDGRAWTPPAPLRPEPRVYGFDMAADEAGRLHLLWQHARPGASDVPDGYRLSYAVHTPCPREAARR